MTDDEILRLPVVGSDVGDTTIAGYLKELLLALWADGEGFSGKRPFGNSGWEYDLYVPLIEAGVVDGSLDSDGYIVDCDDSHAHIVIERCIRGVFK